MGKTVEIAKSGDENPTSAMGTQASDGIASFVYASNAAATAVRLNESETRHLVDRIPTYRKHATEYIERGYRWLVRAQKPELTRAKKGQGYRRFQCARCATDLTKNKKPLVSGFFTYCF
jgi:hypothetical protein